MARSPEEKRVAERARMKRFRKAHPGYETPYTKARRKADPEHDRELRRRAKNKIRPSGLTVEKHRQLQAKYGIDDIDYVAMLTVVPGCAICGGKPRSGRALHVDHDHRTGRVRGLLCDMCNTGLAGFRDSPRLLAMAIDYLGEGV